MKNKGIVGLATLILLIFGGQNINAQFSIGSDNASSYNNSWSDTDEKGYGFGGWAFGGNASGNTGIGSSANNGGATTIDVNGDSFWLSDVNDTGNYIDVFRYLADDLKVGQTFSIDIDVNWRAGYKGIRIRGTDDASSIFVFEVGNQGSGDDYVVKDADTGNGSIGNTYSDDTIFTIKLEQTSESGGNWTIIRSGGVSDTDSGTYSGQVSSFQLYTFQAGSASEQTIYYNNLKISSSEASVKLYGSEGYRLISAPTETSISDLMEPLWTQGATGADVTNGSPNTFSWNKASSGMSEENWNGITDLENTNVTAGNGILAFVYSDDNYDGSVDAYPKTLSVSGVENATNVSPTLNSNADGWTLVGNPFASTIDFDETTKNQLTNVAYVWDNNDGSGDAGTDPNTSGSWKSWNGTTGDLTDGLIKPFQGFFVQNASTVGSQEITFNEQSKSSGGIFYGKIKNPIANAKLVLEGEGVRNSAWIQFSESGSHQDKVQGDALELKSLNQNYAQLGVQKSGEIFDIANLPLGQENYKVPLYIKTTESGRFKLKAEHFEVSDGFKIYLKDEVQGVHILINNEFDYEFELSAVSEKTVSPLVQNEPGSLAVTLKSKKEKVRFWLNYVAKQATGINELREIPSGFVLEQNYPNPFNPSTQIEYALPKAMNIKLAVYNLLGQEVALLVNGYRSLGSHKVNFNANGLSSGLYVYRLEAGSKIITKKLTIIK